MVLVFVACAASLVVVRRPVLALGALGRADRVFMKGLPPKFRAAAPETRHARVAARDDDRRDPEELRDFLRILETIALRPKGRQKPGRQVRAGSGKAAEEGRVGMLVHGAFDLLFQL